MTTADQILIIGGVVTLAYSVLLGFVMTAMRTREGAPPTPKYLTVAHVNTAIMGPAFLGLVWAARMSTLPAGWNTVAAWLVVASGVFIAAKDTLNWLMGVRDEFADKAPTFPLGVAGALTISVGIGILLVGVVAGV